MIGCLRFLRFSFKQRKRLRLNGNREVLPAYRRPTPISLFQACFLIFRLGVQDSRDPRLFLRPCADHRRSHRGERVPAPSL